MPVTISDAALPAPDKRPVCGECGTKCPFTIDKACSPCRNSGKPRPELLKGLAQDSLDYAISKVHDDGFELTGIVGMFSGGNDSTTLAHMFRNQVTHFGHSNTGFGIEETRQYVRDTCNQWNVPLLERYPEPGYGYRELVLGECESRAWWAKYKYIFPGGFPGPAQHPMMFQKLKERGMGQIRTELNPNPRKQRVIFLGGRRAEESARRTYRYDQGELSYVEQRGSVIWVSPMLQWTKLDQNQYRRDNPDVPRNETSDLLHHSGECECGCYARQGELEEIEMWRPDMATQIKELEQQVQKKNLDIDPRTLQWGWNNRGKCASGLCNN